MHHRAEQCRLIAETSHLQLLRRGGWSFVRRKSSTGVVTIVPVTDEHEVVLVEQYRPPVGTSVIEFPAGLAGDVSGAEDESLETAARRELLEETGYEATRWTRLFSGPSSAGLTDEVITFFLATGLRRRHAGGGDDSESIQVHLVPLAQVEGWLAERVAMGCMIDSRLFSGLYFTRNGGLAIDRDAR